MPAEPARGTAAAATPHRDRPSRQLPPPPPAAVMGLLNYLTATSMDEDYAHVSRNRGRQVPDGPKRRGRSALLVLAAFGCLVTTAAVQTARSADDAQTSHDQLAKQVIARKAQLAERRERADDLISTVRTLEKENLAATVEGRALRSRLATLGVATGADAAQGPGVRIEADDGPAGNPKAEVLDADLQKLVNGLWLAGAEAVAINNQRISSLTAIRLGGATITVNFRQIAPPYSITAIGDPDDLATRFIETPGGQWWLDLQALYGVGFEINTEENVILPPAARLDLRHAHTPEELR